MKNILATAAAFAALATCAFAAEIPPKPTQSMVDADRCTWEWLTGAGIGVWSERCTLDTGVWVLKYRDDIRGFNEMIDDEDSGTVLQVFTKPADADPSAIMPELVKRGYVPGDECVFRQTSDDGNEPPKHLIFEVMPTGSRKAAYDATPTDEVPEPPCGLYGMSVDKEAYFLYDTAHPDKVLYLDLGQDGTLFDPETLTFE